MLCLNKACLLIIISGFLLFITCKKEPEPVSSNSVIRGYTDLWGSWGENASIKVVAYGPYGETNVLSGDGGYYTFRGLKSGTYSLDFIKEGYGTIKMYNIKLFGNDTVTLEQVLLFKKYDNFGIPVISNVSIGNNRFSNTTVVMETSMVSYTGILPNPLPVILFTDSLKNVSYKNNAYQNPTVYAAFDGAEKIILIFEAGYLPFKRGTKVYFILYVANPDELNNGYFDKYLGVEQLTTFMPEKHSPVMSFTMP
jgi:hypothetical protein